MQSNWSKPRESGYMAALYMRLSRDDDAAPESASIKTQRTMLRSYAQENGFAVYDEYIDDGWSGTNFARPEFQRMIDDIERKRVNLVITKDLSRLGRDYITTGQYTEIYFPSKGVRYIAINDGYDSDSPYDDIVPFKNVINELYARDTSKKIRSAFLTKMKEGSYIGNFAPYGYQKDPANKNHLLIDEAVAPVVRRIFDMAYRGCKPSEIAGSLNCDGVLTPAAYRCANHTHLSVDAYSKHRVWTSATISKMLRNVTYIGNLAQKKTTKVSFKSKATIQNAREDWIVVENTHQPIIEKDVFDMAGRRSQSRTCEKGEGFVNLFSGIAKCADCGKNMSTVGTRKKTSPANLACGGYKLHGRQACTNHFIDYRILYDIVLKAIGEQVSISEEEQQALARELQQSGNSVDGGKQHDEEMNTLSKKVRQLDSIIEKLYEDHFQGVICDDRFVKLLAKYEKESQAVNDRIHFLSASRPVQCNDADVKKSYDYFLGAVKAYTDIQRLTPDLLYKLIDRIEVGQGRYEQTQQGRVKRQAVTIYFRFAGNAAVGEYVV